MVVFLIIYNYKLSKIKLIFYFNIWGFAPCEAYPQGKTPLLFATVGSTFGMTQRSSYPSDTLRERLYF